MVRVSMLVRSLETRDELLRARGFPGIGTAEARADRAGRCPETGVA